MRAVVKVDVLECFFKCILFKTFACHGPNIHNQFYIVILIESWISFALHFVWLNILHPVPETSHYESKMVCEWQLTLNLTNQPL